MFERFTSRARQSMARAEQTARELGHSYVGTEHLLLGLLADGHSAAVRALTGAGVSTDQLRQRAGEIIGRGSSRPSGPIPITPRTKKSIELSLREALRLGHNHIGTGHMVLGLMLEGEGVAARVLASCGVDLVTMRLQVIALSPGDDDDAWQSPGSTPGSASG